MAADAGDIPRPLTGGGGGPDRLGVVEARDYRPIKRKKPLGLRDPRANDHLSKRPDQQTDERRRIFGSEVELPPKPTSNKKGESSSPSEKTRFTNDHDTSTSDDEPQRPNNKPAADRPIIENDQKAKPPRDRPLNTSWMAHPQPRQRIDNPSNPHVSKLYENKRNKETGQNLPDVSNKVTDLNEKITRPPLTPENAAEFLEELTPEQIQQTKLSKLDPNKYQLRWHKDPATGELLPRVYRRPGADVPKRHYNKDSQAFEVPPLERNLIRATYSPPDSIDKWVSVDQDPTLTSSAKESADARTHIDEANKQLQQLTPESPPEERARAEQELHKARQKLKIASERLGHIAIRRFVQDQYGQDADITWINLKTGVAITGEEMINNVGGGRNQFDALCVVTKDGTTGDVYVIGEGKGGKQNTQLTNRWSDNQRTMRVQQGTSEYVDTIITHMKRRGESEGEIADALIEASKNKALRYIHVRGFLQDTPEGHMFFYSGRFFDLSNRE